MADSKGSMGSSWEGVVPARVLMTSPICLPARRLQQPLRQGEPPAAVQDSQGGTSKAEAKGTSTWQGCDSNLTFHFSVIPSPT